MSNNQGRDTFEELKKWAEIFIEDGNKFYDKGNKAAGKRARHAISQIIRLKVQWRRDMLTTD